MRKLKLEVEELAVESFEASGEDAEGRGTVFGNVRYTDVRYCASNSGCYTDNEPECKTNWYGCPTVQCSGYNCQSIEGVDCW